jgi:hypothetical protein
MRGEEHGREDGLRVRRAERMGGAGIDDSGSGGYVVTYTQDVNDC